MGQFPDDITMRNIIHNIGFLNISKKVASRR